MSDVEKLWAGLENAHAAGDTEAAKFFAGEIAKQRGAPALGAGDTAKDVAKSTGSGIVRGGAYMAGMGGDISNLAQAGADKLQQSGFDVQGMKQEALGAMPAWMRKYHEKPQGDYGSQKIMATIDQTTGLPITSYEPKTPEGKVGRTVGEFIPAAMMGGGGFIRGALFPGALSEAAGHFAEGTKYETPARIAGAVVGGAILPNKTRITAQNLDDAATRNYNNPAVKNLQIDPAGPARLADDAVAAMEARGARPYIAGPAYSGVDELRNLPNTAAGRAARNPVATVEDIKGVRTVLGNVIQEGTDPLTGKLNTSANAANTARRKITDYLDDIPPGDVLHGDPKAAQAALSAANQDYAAARRSQVVDALLRKGEVNAGAANSGQNVNNTTRQQLKSLLLNEKKSAGFNDAEMAQLERAVLGTGVGNKARFIGNALAPSGALMLNNSAAAGALGAGAGYLADRDPTTSALTAALATHFIGRGARGIANASTARQADKFRDMVASRSALANDKEALKALGINPTPSNLAIVQALMASRPQELPQPRQPVNSLR